MAIPFRNQFPIASTFLFWVLLLFFFHPVKAQQDSTPAKTLSRPKHSWSVMEKGFIIGYGYGVNSENLPEGIYSPIFLIGKISIDFPRLNYHLASRSRVALLFEPQINPVILRDRGPNRLEFEVGLGVGIEYKYILGQKFALFTHLIVGPQYFSTKTIRQTTGLIFSDNLGGGLSYTLKNSWAILAEFRIRHMSNANIVLPNSGINTNNFLIGISRFLH